MEITILVYANLYNIQQNFATLLLTILKFLGQYTTFISHIFRIHHYTVVNAIDVDGHILHMITI